MSTIWADRFPGEGNPGLRGGPRARPPKDELSLRGRNRNGIVADGALGAGRSEPQAPQLAQPSAQLPVACFGCKCKPSHCEKRERPRKRKRIDADVSQRWVSRGASLRNTTSALASTIGAITAYWIARPALMRTSSQFDT